MAKRSARRAILGLGAGATGVVVLLAPIFAETVMSGLSDGSHANDFNVFYGAARLVLEGRAQAVFDDAALHAGHPLPEGTTALRYTGWLYPPAFLAVLAPFGLLPLAWAWAAFALASAAVYGAAARALIGQGGWALIAAIGAPALWVTLLIGNISAAAAGVLGLALAALAQRREWQAGVLIGLLTMKPTLGVLLPFALAAVGAWRAFGAAAATGVGLIVFGTALAGTGFWPLLAERLAWASSVDGPGAEHITGLISAYGIARGAGLAHGPAMALQWGAFGLLALATVWAWRRPVGPWAKAGWLLIAAPLATPHAFYYEMVFPSLGALALLRWEGAGRGIAALAILLHAFPILRVAAPEASVFSGHLLLGALMVLAWRFARLTPVASAVHAGGPSSNGG